MNPELTDQQISNLLQAAKVPPESEPPVRSSVCSATGWAYETMMAINRLTPEVKGKAFDPDWFLLRQRLEQAEAVMKACESALRSYQYGNEATELAEEVADKLRALLQSPNARTEPPAN